VRVSAPPRYRSTRGADDVDLVTALRLGLAPDGGLFVPASVPRLDAAWRSAERFTDVAEMVLRPFLPPDEADAFSGDLRDALDFPVPLVALDDDTFLLELFHGPTLAFKDVAARTMARWWSRALAGRAERALVLVATSGDTGSAVADGFAGVPGLQVAVLFPAGRVSPVQERQLTVARPGVETFAVEGTFDDCQRLVKAALVDRELADVPLSSANSINVGRLLPQATYYAWAVLQLMRARGDDDPRPIVSVPSGNLGNLTAGLLAAAMGVPIGAFVAAHNANDYFPRFLAGEIPAFRFPPTVATVANAMDVGAPSNFERLHAMFQGEWPVPLQGVRVDDPDTLGRIASTYRERGRLVCPHTAIGLEALERVRRAPGTGSAERSGIALATAHAAKFPEVVARALPGTTATHPVLDALAGAEHRVTPLAADLESLRPALRRLAAR
jgi:threonine synthase